MKRIVLGLIAVDTLLLLAALLGGNRLWLINLQIGFISSALVMLASIVSYRNMVQGRVASGMVVAEDNRDTLDKIEDPYDLYEEGVSEPDESSKRPFKEIVQEERDRIKKQKRSLWQIGRDSKAALSFYRLGAYVVLIVGFFYLNNHKILDIVSYLLALSLPPVVVVFLLMREK